MPGHELIVVGASAGGIEALNQLLRGLPADLPAALAVVVHVSPNGAGLLPRVLSRAGPLPALQPRQGEAPRHGRVYVAPPDHHLLIRDGVFHLSRGPRENGHRPAADPLFRSAAWSFGPRVIGVVLSGNLDDGTAGLQAVKLRGGLAVVQHPDDALCSGMPQNALENVTVDHVVPVADMAALLVRLAHEPVNEEAERTMAQEEELELETEMADMDPNALGRSDLLGAPSAFSCPDCGGSLFELHDAKLVRYRCRVGHAYAPESLAAAQSQAVEDALWTALRALKERAALARRLAERMKGHGAERATERYEEQARDAEQHAAVIRELIEHGAGRPPAEPPAAPPPAA